MNRILFAILVCAGSTAADDIDAVKHKLVGTWKLLSYVREESPSGAKIAMFGPHSSGYLTMPRTGA
jgi:hypothetical protein